MWFSCGYCCLLSFIVLVDWQGVICNFVGWGLCVCRRIHKVVEARIDSKELKAYASEILEGRNNEE